MQGNKSEKLKIVKYIYIFNVRKRGLYQKIVPKDK